MSDETIKPSSCLEVGRNGRLCAGAEWLHQNIKQLEDQLAKDVQLSVSRYKRIQELEAALSVYADRQAWREETFSVEPWDIAEKALASAGDNGNG